VIAAIWEIARHEIVVTLRTRRALTMLAIYLGSALAVGLGYALSVRFIEQGLGTWIGEESALPAGRALDLIAEPAYRQLLGFLAGAPFEELAPSLIDSPILPFVLWGSLAFLPFLILVTSFDQLASDLESRGICYTTLRSSRGSIVLGKALGHTALCIVLSALSGLLLLVLTAVLVERVEVLRDLPGLLRLILLLAPFGACYVAIAGFASVSLGRPFPALIASLLLVGGLRILSWTRFASEDGDLALLRPLRWLSPATYQSGFWQGGTLAPAASAAAYLAIAGLFLGAAVWVMRRRGL